MRLITTSDSRLELSKALQLMTEALDLLDEIDAPGEIGSMLDLAVSRLERFLDRDDQTANRVQTLMSQLEREFSAASANSGFKPSPWNIPPV